MKNTLPLNQNNLQGVIIKWYKFKLWLIDRQPVKVFKSLNDRQADIVIWLFELDGFLQFLKFEKNFRLLVI